MEDQITTLAKSQTTATLSKMLTSLNLRSVETLDEWKPAIDETNPEQFFENKNPSDEESLTSALAALIFNVECNENGFSRKEIDQVITKIDSKIEDQINVILHDENFQKLESNWRGLQDLVNHTDLSDNVIINILDVAKEEIFEDFEENEGDYSDTALYRILHDKAYDQFGAVPFAGVVGLYEFTYNTDDLKWLQQMAKICSEVHTPFISSVSPKFFGCQNTEELANLKTLDFLEEATYNRWQSFRKKPEAAYIGLTLPKYILRVPYGGEEACKTINFTEHTGEGDNSKYLWGNSSILFARNMVRSFQEAGWCQYLRGPEGGGLIDDLSVHTFEVRGNQKTKIPVEMIVSDSRELEFANHGFIPLVHKSNSGEAAFFSCQSVKKPEDLKDPRERENSQLACNLAYTLSIARIAHHVKIIGRRHIGTTADENFIKDLLNDWIFQYVTKVKNPNDKTLRYYPFEDAKIEVSRKDGELGWYQCKIVIKPHIQFEGMDVTMSLDSKIE